MEQVRLGELLKGHEKRDAVHVAIEPVVAGEELEPGTRVGVSRLPGEPWFLIHASGSTVGIVDPMLRQAVKKGERCYLWVYPNTVLSLRHSWIHPILGDERD